jgi:NTE family protein
MVKRKKKIALVIGWGNIKCAASLGLMRVLKREGIDISLMVAGGGGSIFGSLFALGYDNEEIIQINNKLWANGINKRPNRMALLQILFPKIFKTKNYFHLRDSRMINERLKIALGNYTFRDTQIPLFVTATDYYSGEQVVISDGSLFEAVSASMAMPLIYPPVLVGNTLLADSYLSDPLPVKELI